MKLAIGLYGLYLLMVVIKGKGGDFAQGLQADGPGFLPWLISAGVLGALYEWDKTRTVAALFLALVVLTFLLKNFAKLKAEFTPIYNSALSSSPASADNSITVETLAPLGTSGSTQR